MQREQPAGHDRHGAIGLVACIARGVPVSREDAMAVLCHLANEGDWPRQERIARRRLRDDGLRDAARALDFDDCGSWHQATRLAVAVQRFEGVVWPRLQAGLLRELSPVDDGLCQAFLSGERVPKTARHLYELLKN